MKNPFILAAFLLTCTTVQADEPRQIKFEGQCLPKGVALPGPWALVNHAGLHSFYYNSPHFSAPMSSFGVSVKDAADSDRANAFVVIRTCSPNERESSSSNPCRAMKVMQEATKSGAGFHTARKKIAGMEIGYRRFWASDHHFLGMCDDVDFQSLAISPPGICRIWLPRNDMKRGLYVVLPAEAFLKIPAIMQQVEQFLDSKYDGCAIANYWEFH